MIPNGVFLAYPDQRHRRNVEMRLSGSQIGIVRLTRHNEQLYYVMWTVERMLYESSSSGSAKRRPQHGTDSRSR